MSREEKPRALKLRDSVQPEPRMRLEARLLLLLLPLTHLVLLASLLNPLLPLPTRLARLAEVAPSVNLSHSSSNLNKTLSVVLHLALSLRRSVRLQEHLEQRRLLLPHRPLAPLAPLDRLPLLLVRLVHLVRRNLQLPLDLELSGSPHLLQLNLRRPVLVRLDSQHNSSNSNPLLPPMLSVSLSQVDLARLELVSQAIHILIVQSLTQHCLASAKPNIFGSAPAAPATNAFGQPQQAQDPNKPAQSAFGAAAAGFGQAAQQAQQQQTGTFIASFYPDVKTNHQRFSRVWSTSATPAKCIRCLWPAATATAAASAEYHEQLWGRTLWQ